MIRLPRYTKAAGEQGSQVVLTCYIRTEPTPQIGWIKDNKPIVLESQSSIKKYQAGILHIRPGLYKATLAVNDLGKTDFGNYGCQVNMFFSFGILCAK